MINESDLQKLYSYALMLTNNGDYAYDLVHYSIEKILERTFISNKFYYAKKVIRNRFYDLKRFEAKFVDAQYVIEELSFDDFETIEINKNEVEFLLSNLKAEERELLYMWAVEGYTLAEIAKENDIPKGTLTVRVSRLRKKIIERSKKGGQPDES